VSFEVVEPGGFGLAPPLPEGEVSISRSGALTAHAKDLEIVGIGNYAIVLADSDTLRVAFRDVRDGEQQQSVCASVVRRKSGVDTGRRSINVGRAIKRLGLTNESVAGRYTLNVHKDLLIVNLTEAREAPNRETRGGDKGK
jgi:hypothetical protein